MGFLNDGTKYIGKGPVPRRTTPSTPAPTPTPEPDTPEEGIISSGVVYRVVMIKADNIAGDEQTTGFDLYDAQTGRKVRKQIYLELGLFRELACINLAQGTGGVVAYLHTASVGEIIDGENTCAVKVLTDVNGEFRCKAKITSVRPGTVYVNAFKCARSPALDCTEYDAITFEEDA